MQIFKYAKMTSSCSSVRRVSLPLGAVHAKLEKRLLICSLDVKSAAMYCPKPGGNVKEAIISTTIVG